MEWMTLSGDVPCLPLISLGTFHKDKYYVSDECLVNLEQITIKLITEDSSTRSLRRALGILDIINKDLIPILKNSSNEPCIFRSTLKLLVWLTVPVECLVDASNNRSPLAQQVDHELTQHLYNAKEAFLDPNATRAVLSNLHRLVEKQPPLSSDESQSVNHSMLLIRNILHAPQRPSNKVEVADNEVPCASSVQSAKSNSTSSYFGQQTRSHGCAVHNSQQNRLLWNLFAQGLDRLLTTFLSSSQKDEWVVTIVQLVVVLYKEQNIENIQKQLAAYTSATKSDTSEDESNTSSLCSGDGSSTWLQASPSDSASVRSENASAQLVDANMEWESPLQFCKARPLKRFKRFWKSDGRKIDRANSSGSSQSDASDKSSRLRKHSASSGFYSDYSEHQQLVQQSASGASRNEKNSKRLQNSNGMTETNVPVVSALYLSNLDILDDSVFMDSETSELVPTSRSTETVAKERIRKWGKMQPSKEDQRRILKRSRTMGSIKTKYINQFTPTEKDVLQLLTDFTRNFLHYGYNTLVGRLHQQLLHKNSTPLDKSHFFWIIVYFLRFASQLKLDMGHFEQVFNVDLLCYLIYQSVRETEEFEINSSQPSVNLKPYLRRLHLGAMAIKEYMHALETYSLLGNTQTGGNKSSQGCSERIALLRSYLPAIRDLRQLFLLQLRHFNPLIQSRRYLRDIITANHILLLTLERASLQSSYGACFDLRQHLNQFCSRMILSRYSFALEDFKTNGSFANDCILTLLHHVAGDLGQIDLLCEPTIFHLFSKIWENQFNVCDDWKDLIKYVVQKFFRNFQTSICCESGLVEPVTRQHCINEHDLMNQTSSSNMESVRDQLLNLGFQKQLDWIQSSLLKVCSARLGTYTGQEFRNPIICLSLKMNAPCPIVPWTEEEAAALNSELFLFLLHQMSLLPRADDGALFPRIPNEWSVDTLYSVALFFGPVYQQKVDFDLTRVKKVDLSTSTHP